MPWRSAPMARRCITGSEDKTARLWDAATGQPSLRVPMRHEMRVMTRGVQPRRQDRAHREPRQDGAALGRGDGPAHRDPMPHQGQCQGRGVQPRRQDRAHRERRTSTARLWDAATGRPIGQPDVASRECHGRGVQPRRQDPCSPGLRQRQHGAALGRGDWPAHRASDAASRGCHGRGVQPRRQDRAHRELRTTRRGSGTRRPASPSGLRCCIKGRSGPWRSAPTARRCSPGAEDNTARLWDAATGQPIGPPCTHHGGSGPWRSAPTARPCSPGAQTTRRGSGTPRRPSRSGCHLQHHAAVKSESVAFSPDGKSVLTGSYDNTARLWDARDRPAHRPHHAASRIRSRPWRSARRQDRAHRERRTSTARLWDAATGQPIGTPMLHRTRVEAVAFSPDGKTVLTGSCGQHGAAVGRGDGPAHRGPDPASRDMSWPWRSAPTARPC